MNILLLGSGAREYAIKLALEAAGVTVYWAPGNGGAAPSQRVALDIDNFSAVVNGARQWHCEIIVPGAEKQICNGLGDYVAECAPEIKFAGPNKAAAEFEADKHLTKHLCFQSGVRSAGYQVAHTLSAVMAAIGSWGFPVVLKYPYLAAGKGVKVARDHSTADPFAHSVLEQGVFGRKKLLVEQFVAGQELSVFAVCNGEEAVWIGEACDYKLATDDPKENRMTGGMGAYSPAPWVSSKTRIKINDLLAQLMRGMKAMGRPYCGVLYVGLMIDPEGNPWLIEINCRLGDPEAQVILPRLEVGVFHALMLWSLNMGPKPMVSIKDIAAVYTVLCAKEYPDDYSKTKGYPIEGLAVARTTGCEIIHAGTDLVDGKLVGVGGRVLGTLGLGSTFEEARLKSQKGASVIVDYTPQLRYRPDIAAGL